MSFKEKVMRRFFCLMVLSTLVTSVAVFAGRRAGATGSQESAFKEVKIDPKIFDDYVGQYAIPTNPDVVLSFFREGDKYYVQATNQGRIEIFPASESKFFVKLFDAQ